MSECTLCGGAFVISLISLALSTYVAFRDRGNVTASARYLESIQHISDAVFIHVVNSGRRPVTVRRLVFETHNGHRLEHKLVKESHPVRLMESEDYEFQINAENSVITNWAGSKIVKAALEDSRGKKYEVEDLAELINRKGKYLKSAILLNS